MTLYRKFWSLTFIIVLSEFEMGQTGADWPWPPAGDYRALVASVTALADIIVPGAGHCELEPLIDRVSTSRSPLVALDRRELDLKRLCARDRGEFSGV